MLVGRRRGGKEAGENHHHQHRSYPDDDRSERRANHEKWGRPSSLFPAGRSFSLGFCPPVSTSRAYLKKTV